MPNTVLEKTEKEQKYCTQCCESADKIIYTDIWGEYCRECYKKYFFKCSSCNLIYSEDSLQKYGNNKYCEDCFHEKYFECEYCIKIKDINKKVEVDTWTNACEDCMMNGKSFIMEYDSKPLSLRGCTFDKIKHKRCFGIELEIDDDNINCYKMCRQKTHFGCYDDCLDGGMEFYSPILKGDIGYNQIKAFCRNIGKPIISSQAGFHIHIDTRDLSRNNQWKKIRKIYYLFTSIEQYIFSIVDYSRRENTYCERHYLHSVEDILRCRTKEEMNGLMCDYGSGKFSGLHIDDWDCRRTIELRYHHGTANFDDVINWVNLNLGIFEFARKSSIKKIKEVLKFDKKDTEEQRLKKIIYRITKSRKLVNFYVKKYKAYK